MFESELHNEIFHALIIGTLFLVIFSIAELWRWLRKPDTEATRKFVHLSSGVVALSFSYLFRYHWTILILCLLFVTILLVSKRTGHLQSIHDVERATRGGIYFPVAVYLVFLLSNYHGNPHFYFISVLVLAVSDTLAALVGSSYGQKKYRVEEDRKSFEGSIIFFLATFIIVHLGLLLLTDAGRIESVLLGIFIALLVTTFESICLEGTDNIFIPLGTTYILVKMFERSPEFIGGRILLFIAILSFTYLIYLHKRKIGFSGAIGVGLLGFGAWSLVGFTWYIPVFMGFILFTYFDLFTDKVDKRSPRIRAVFYILGVSLFWILTANLFREENIFYVFLVPYLVNFAANFSILWEGRCRIQRAKRRKNRCSGSKNHIVTAGFLLRGIILLALFVPVHFIFKSELSWWYTLVSSYLGIVLSDRIYWFIADRQHYDWTAVNFLRMGFAVTMSVSIIICILNLWFYGIIA